MSDAFVGVQVGVISFIDEGVDGTLDTLQQRGAVNAICVSALSWARGNAGRALFSFPDHGVAEPDNLQGGAFFPPIRATTRARRSSTSPRPIPSMRDSTPWAMSRRRPASVA